MRQEYSDFLRIKEFFIEREGEYVFYRVKPFHFRDAYNDYCRSSHFKDGFYIEFDWRCDTDRYAMDSYDSFVFGFWCAYYGDRIEFSDCNRTWECGVEAYEGTGLFAKHFDEVEAVIKRHGYSFSTQSGCETVIQKVTSTDTFVRDAIELVRLMLLINRITGEPPYINEDDPDVLDDIRALEESWLTDCPKHPKCRGRRAIDLTHEISPDMPTFPGDPKPSFKVNSDYENRKPCITDVSFNTHTGTHIDMPSHFFLGSRTLSDLPPDAFVGKALVIDCRDLAPGEQITKEHILKQGDLLNQASFLLFCTGWDKKWGTPEYFEGYPILDLFGAGLCCDGNFRGIGFDTPSVDLADDDRYWRHGQILSDNTVFIIENLKNLDLIAGRLVDFAALPLKLADADGAPVRAIAWLDEE